jgi:hypothetical protein
MASQLHSISNNEADDGDNQQHANAREVVLKCLSDATTNEAKAKHAKSSRHNLSYLSKLMCAV